MVNEPAIVRSRQSPIDFAGEPFVSLQTERALTSIAAGEKHVVARDSPSRRILSMAFDDPNTENAPPEPAGRVLGGARGLTRETEGWAAPMTGEEADAFLGIGPRLA